MSQRPAIEAALAEWREAERRLAAATNGNTDALKAEVARHRDEFHQLSGAHIAQQIRLQVAEQRRRDAVPSSSRDHDATQEERALAAEFWEEARLSDEEAPQPSRRETDARTKPVVELGDALFAGELERERGIWRRRPDSNR